MPEGDTVYRTAHRLHQVFAGRPLVRADLRWPGLSTYELAGRVTTEVVPRGKHILHRLDDGWTMHSHLRMDGSWTIVRPDASPPTSGTVRAVLGTDEYAALGDSLGMLDVVRTSDEASVVGHLGPDLLGDDWDADRAVANLSRAPGTLAAALLDQTNLAGLGTIWAAESLFAARLDPFAAASATDPATLKALVSRARTMLRASATGALPSSTGSRVRGASTYVHGRQRQPCRRCGTTIEMRKVGPSTRERPLFFCPRCQGVDLGGRGSLR